MSSIELLGFFGGAITTLGFIPQVINVYRLKSAREISLPFLVFFLLGISMWLLYGTLRHLPPVILWNAITLVLALLLLYAKLKYGKVNVRGLR